MTLLARQSATDITEKNASLANLIEDFPADIRQANYSPTTVRAYASDLAQFAAFSPCAASAVTAETLPFAFSRLPRKDVNVGRLYAGVHGQCLCLK